MELDKTNEENVPWLQQPFTFRHAKRLSIILLIIGTFTYVVQVPKAVFMTSAIFSDQSVVKEHEDDSRSEMQVQRQTERF